MCSILQTHKTDFKLLAFRTYMIILRDITIIIVHTLSFNCTDNPWGTTVPLPVNEDGVESISIGYNVALR